MKKLLTAAISALALFSCAQKPQDIFIPKGTMEFAGNGFDTFSLGADVRVYMSPDQDNPKLWNIQAVVPVRKETEAIISALDMELVLHDDKGIRVRDSFSLMAEDMENLVPVFNSAPSVEKTVVFSVPEVDGGKKRFPYKQAKAMIEATKGARLSINAEEIEVEEEKPEDIPNTLPWLIKRTGVGGLLYQYGNAVKKKDLRKAGDIESKIYKIEKDVKNNDRYPESLRKRFIDYVENKIEDIDDKH
ncbi:MAG: hypothetical protein IJU21_03245 [Bacteroidales bacterium]|nr:hypothetical protein [Bacteroidales bacterium]